MRLAPCITGARTKCKFYSNLSDSVIFPYLQSLIFGLIFKKKIFANIPDLLFSKISLLSLLRTGQQHLSAEGLTTLGARNTVTL